MNRDYLLRAFDQERAEKRHARRQRFPGWLSYAPTRPVGRREREDPWLEAKAIALIVVAWLLIYLAASAMPEHKPPPSDPRGYTVQP